MELSRHLNRSVLLLAGCLLTLHVTVLGGEVFHKPVRLKADGKWIDTDIGHAAPFVSDIDGDGKRDLLVGQFGGGKLKIYRNVGTDERPRYRKATWFRAGRGDGTVPSG